MHETFVFPIDCHSPQVPLHNPEIVETELGLYVREKELNFEGSYDAFETVDIIPSLIDTVEKMKKRGLEGYKKDEHIDLVIDWMKRWGYLKTKGKSPYLIETQAKGKKVGMRNLNGKRKARIEGISNKVPNNFEGQRVSGFIQEAYKFYDFWILYRSIVNKDIKELENIITVHEDPTLPFEATHTFYFFENRNVEHAGYTDSTFYKEDPLSSYQGAAIIYLTETIQKYINNNIMYSKQTTRIPGEDKDDLKIKPALGFLDLIDAIYMQFFILLNEHKKKICQICNIPFSPARKDRIYCSETCRNTAKSRRYREKYKKEHGKNYWE